MQNLNRDVINIVQIHNATVDIIRSGHISEILIEAKDYGTV